MTDFVHCGKFLLVPEQAIISPEVGIIKIVWAGDSPVKILQERLQDSALDPGRLALHPCQPRRHCAAVQRLLCTWKAFAEHQQYNRQCQFTII